MINVEFLDRWDDVAGDGYLVVIIDEDWCCTVKKPIDNGMYVMQFGDGNEAEHRTGDSFRVLTEEEHEVVMEFAKEQFETEAMLDEAYEREVNR